MTDYDFIFECRKCHKIYSYDDAFRVYEVEDIIEMASGEEKFVEKLQLLCPKCYSLLFVEEEE